MTTGLECLIFEAKPGQWYYAMQRWDCPIGAMDTWTDYADIVGPFKTVDHVYEWIWNHDANPGQSTEAFYGLTQKYAKFADELVARAVQPNDLVDPTGQSS